jgi:hypothetical protein
MNYLEQELLDMEGNTDSYNEYDDYQPTPADRVKADFTYHIKKAEMIIAECEDILAALKSIK